jgi:hypothetical protein
MLSASEASLSTVVMLSVSEASLEILRFPFALLRASAQNDKRECPAERPSVMLSASEASLEILRFAQNDKLGLSC